MEMGKRLATAGAITATAALAGVVGVSGASANPIPPKARHGPGRHGRAGARAGAGGADVRQRHGAERLLRDTADWISGEVWVESSFDTDGDGKKDRMHADYTLPKETATDGLKVPVIYEDSPYYAGTGAGYATGSSTTSSARRRRRARSRRSRRHATRARRSARSTSRTWLPRGFARRALRVARHGLLRRLPDLRRPQRDARRDRRSSTGSTAAARPTRPAPAPSRPPAVNWHNGHTAMMGTSYNGTIPIAAATTGVAGPRRDRPDLGDLRLVRLLPRQRHGPRAALRRRRHRQQLLPRRGPRRARRRRLLAAATRTRPAAHICRPDDRRDRRQGGPPDRATATRSGRSATT